MCYNHKNKKFIKKEGYRKMAIKIALLGLGTVGSGVLKIIKNNQKRLNKQVEKRLLLKKPLFVILRSTKILLKKSN